MGLLDDLRSMLSGAQSAAVEREAALRRDIATSTQQAAASVNEQIDAARDLAAAAADVPRRALAAAEGQVQRAATLGRNLTLGLFIMGAMMLIGMAIAILVIVWRSPDIIASIASVFMTRPA